MAVFQQKEVVDLGETHTADDELIGLWRAEQFLRDLIVRGADLIVEVEPPVPERSSE